MNIGTATSCVSALLDALRGVPKIADAVRAFISAVRERPEITPALGNAAREAQGRFLQTFLSTLQLRETYASAKDPEPQFTETVDAEAVLREQYGFVPRIFTAQGAWPELVAAEVQLLRAVVFDDVALTRGEKECLLLAAAVANRNEYGCALQFNLLKLLGEEAEAARILNSLSPGDNPLERLVWANSSGRPEQDAARAYEKVLADGFTEAHALEALSVCAIGNMMHALQSHLQPAPDFQVPPLPKKDLYPNSSEVRPTPEQPVRDDPDSRVVANVKSGDTEAFAELIRRHTQKVFATLMGMLGDAEEARDVSQEVFLKAFQKLPKFEGRAKFSSWLISIAINTGTEVLRKRRNFESIDGGDDDEEWRPRQIQEWSDNPEECFAKEEMKDLVRQGVMRLPRKYRVALLVRDVSQLSTEDAADALGISVPALKARVLRGRLMLREALAPHFGSARERGAHG